MCLLKSSFKEVRLEDSLRVSLKSHFVSPFVSAATPFDIVPTEHLDMESDNAKKGGITYVSCKTASRKRTD